MHFRANYILCIIHGNAPSHLQRACEFIFSIKLQGLSAFSQQRSLTLFLCSLHSCCAACKNKTQSNNKSFNTRHQTHHIPIHFILWKSPVSHTLEMEGFIWNRNFKSDPIGFRMVFCKDTVCLHTCTNLLWEHQTQERKQLSTWNPFNRTWIKHPDIFRFINILTFQTGIHYAFLFIYHLSNHSSHLSEHIGIHISLGFTDSTFLKSAFNFLKKKAVIWID